MIHAKIDRWKGAPCRQPCRDPAPANARGRRRNLTLSFGNLTRSLRNLALSLGNLTRSLRNLTRSLRDLLRSDGPADDHGSSSHDGVIDHTGCLRRRRMIDLRARSRAHCEARRRAPAHREGKLSTLPGIRIIGPRVAAERSGLVSFAFADVHAHDLATFADEDGVALNGGHHCNQALMRKLGPTSTTRASFYLYNT